MTQRYLPLRKPVPENAPIPMTEPGLQVYSNVPGTPNQWKRITDPSQGGDSDVKSLRHHYAQVKSSMSDDKHWVTALRWYCELWHFDDGFVRTIGNQAFFPRPLHHDPDHVIGIDKQKPYRLVKVNVHTSAESLIREFTDSDMSVSTIKDVADAGSIGRTQGGLSYDDSRCVVQMQTDDGGYECLLTDLNTGNIISRKHFAAMDDYATVHPDGKHILVYNHGTYDNGGNGALYGAKHYDVYDENWNFLKAIGCSGHIGLGFDFDGVTPVVIAEASWRLVKIRLDTGVEAPTVIAGGPNRLQNDPYSMSLHVSTCFDTPGYYIVTTSDPEGPDVIFTVSCEPSNGLTEDTYLWAYHQSRHGLSGGSYYGEPHANCIGHGDRVFFASDWGNSTIREYLVQTRPAMCPFLGDQTFQVNQNSAVGTHVGQLVATDPQNNNASITSKYRLMHLKNAGFAISDSGEITVAQTSATAELGTQTTTAIVEGLQGNTFNDVTIEVVASGANGIVVPLDGQQHSYNMGREINTVGRRTTGTGGSNNLPVDPHGHFRMAGSLSGTDKRTGILNVIDSTHSAYPWNSSNKKKFRGFLIRTRWDKLNASGTGMNGSDVDFMHQVYDKCDNEGTLVMNNILDISFGLNTSNATHTRSFAPSDIENNGGSTVSGNPSNIAACAKLWVDWVADRFIAMLIAYHNEFKSHASYRGIMLPETSRSEHTGGSYSSGGNYRNVADDFFPRYKRIVDEVNAAMMSGDNNGYLNYHINFMSGSQDYVPDLFAHAATKTGVEVGTPDFNYDWYEDNPNHGNKIVKAYRLMRQYNTQIPIAPSCETRDIGTTPDHAYKMGFEVGSNSIKPHTMYWFTEYNRAVDTGTWRNRVFNMLESKNWVSNRDVPDSDKSGSTVTTGKNPTFLNASFSGSNLLLSSKSNATVDSVDEFTVEYKDALGTDETTNATFKEVVVVKGTLTAYNFLYHDFVDDDLVEGVAPKWVKDTSKSGYTGTHAYRANGANTTTENGTNENGDKFEIDLTSIGAGTKRVYFRVHPTSPVTDSFRVKFKNEELPTEGFQFMGSSIYNMWSWIELRDPRDRTKHRTVTAADERLDVYIRESDFYIDSYVIIDAEETQKPIGLCGYVGEVWPGSTVLAAPTDIEILKNQSVNTLFTLTLTPEIASTNNTIYVVDENNVQVPFTSNIITTSLGNNQFEISADITGQTVGNYRVVCRVTYQDQFIEESTNITVSAVTQSQWPTGVSATIAQTKTVTVGSEFTLNPNPQNPANFDLKSDRWDSSDTDVISIVSSDDNTATFRAESVGTAIIIYRMNNANDDTQTLIYNMNVTVIAASVIQEDEFNVANTAVDFSMDVLVNDSQTRITDFTQPANGVTAYNGDKTRILYTPNTGYVGPDIFTYSADNGDGTQESTAQVSINVTNPDSFDNSVKATIGADKIGTAGDTIRYTLKIIANPNNYGIEPTWSVNIDASLVTQFKLQENKYVAILQTSRPIFNETDIEGVVSVDLNLA